MVEVKEYGLPGVKIYNLKMRPDERGFFLEALREDWSNLLEGDKIVQANLSSSYPGVIRGWHRHARGQVDYFLVLQGMMKICAYDGGENASATVGKLVEIIASFKEPQLVRIPGFYWHGTMTVSREPSLLVYFTTKLYDYENPDEERRPWDDPSILDPATGRPFDWHKPIPE
jgi:dTDP-4-dehydrorhamnose 3,5-epimerase